MNNELEVCQFCLLDVCNGMGSAEMPRTTAIINRFPIAKIFKRSFQIHDMDHHLQIGFELSNELLISHMKAELKNTEFKGWKFVRIIKRNWYKFVISKIGWFIGGKSGKEAYVKGKCKNFPLGYIEME